MNREARDRISSAIIGAAIEVHRHLGPGLLESTYEAALGFELQIRGHDVAHQARLPVRYKGLDLPTAYRIDLIVARTVVVELKVVERLTPLHEAQVLTYMRHGDFCLGLLLNFNVPVMRDGVRRLVHRH